VYLDQEAVTKQIGRLEPLSTSAFYRDRKRFYKQQKLTFLGKIPLVAFEFNFITAT
jgi:hypothetical protein